MKRAYLATAALFAAPLVSAGEARHGSDEATVEASGRPAAPSQTLGGGGDGGGITAPGAAAVDGADIAGGLDAHPPRPRPPPADRHPAGFDSWANQVWGKGERAPPELIGKNHGVHDWLRLGLRRPAYGCAWVKIATERVLISLSGGEIVDVILRVYYDEPSSDGPQELIGSALA